MPYVYILTKVRRIEKDIQGTNETDEASRSARRCGTSVACPCERTRKRERERIRETNQKTESEREREKGAERKGGRESGRENARSERGSKECMGTRRKRADRDLPVPHSTNAKASSPALLSSESPGATGHGLTP